MNPIEVRKIRKPDGPHGFDDMARRWSAPDEADDRARRYDALGRKHKAQDFTQRKLRARRDD